MNAHDAGARQCALPGGAARASQLRPQGGAPLARLLAVLALLVVPGAGAADSGRVIRSDDGYDLWLRDAPVDLAGEGLVATLRAVHAPAIDESPVLATAAAELRAGLSAALGRGVSAADGPGEGTVLLGTPQTLPLLDRLGLPLADLGEEGYVVRALEIDGRRGLVVAANAPAGALYGAFALLRYLRTEGTLDGIDLVDAPAVDLRLLNHWDNPDGHVERGYAGRSIWDWWRLPGLVDDRYTDYARANASLGINGAVLNNVNAHAEMLTPRFIAKAAAIAGALRPFGIRVYLSARFSAPIEIGGLDTADPLDAEVAAWWRDRAHEIYAAIPDFGGFLVKANSEGQPGPQDYGRSHADGANMLAAAVAPHGGIVMWRAFVYSDVDPEDRVKQAYSEFEPLDGEFAANVLVQVKNGPLDFQPREPFHPLFGAMPRTPLMMEFQITQEYLGFSTHLVYLGALWEEVFDSDTYVDGKGSLVSDVVDGSLHGYPITGVAGVANIGSDRDWSGSIFGQANWYAFGRLAWNPDLDARAVAAEWLAQTFTRDAEFVAKATDMMMISREAVVNYMTPLGLTHIMGTGHHYGPAPWVDDLSRPEWNPWYYHRATADAVGFDRTASGSNAVAQYAPPVAARFRDLAKTPDDYLLWFHRLSWDRRLDSGQTLWEALVGHYDQGVGQVGEMQATWAALAQYVDGARHRRVA
ncbi:MAG TPA: alpha-glucuronidase family glycosyl hydrolase, partial [Woeseiaceae bacterium]|nr:alpha-glucuronidase family glycosyl hydrolase [Woeseiaceae bacterium]